MTRNIVLAIGAAGFAVVAFKLLSPSHEPSPLADQAHVTTAASAPLPPATWPPPPRSATAPGAAPRLPSHVATVGADTRDMVTATTQPAAAGAGETFAATAPRPAMLTAAAPVRQAATDLSAALQQWQGQPADANGDRHIDITIVGHATPAPDAGAGAPTLSDATPAAADPAGAAAAVPAAPDCTLYRGGNDYARLILQARGCRL